MRKTTANLYSAIFFLVFALGYWFAIPLTIKVTGDGVTAATFPQFIAICMMLLSMGQIISAMRQRKKEIKTGTSQGVIQFDKHNELRVLIMFLFIVVYVVLFHCFQFVIATAVFTTASLLLFGERRWWAYLSVYGFCTLVYIIFTKVLLISL